MPTLGHRRGPLFGQQGASRRLPKRVLYEARGPPPMSLSRSSAEAEYRVMAHAIAEEELHISIPSTAIVIATISVHSI
jgi:hypothetical protein